MRHELGLLSNFSPGSPILTSIQFPISLLRAPIGPFTLQNLSRHFTHSCQCVHGVVCFSLQANVADSSSSDYHADLGLKPVTFACSPAVRNLRLTIIHLIRIFYSRSGDES